MKYKTTFEKNSCPVAWYEGMPLESSTFQHNQIYFDFVSQFLTSSITPNSWGIKNLEWETLYLSEGILSIKTIESILPNFSHFVFPIFEDDSLEIDLNKYKEDLSKEPLFVFLSVSQDYTSHSKGAFKAKYDIKTVENIKDWNDSENQTSISLLKTIGKLHIGKAPLERSLSIPLAKVKFSGLAFEFEEYIPPCLNLKTAQPIYLKVIELIEKGRDKIRYFMNQNTNDARNKSLTLSQIILPLEGIIKLNLPLSTLYYELIKSISHALFFQKNRNIPMIPNYDHLNIESSILPLLNFIETALNNTKEAYKRISFSKNKNIFATLINSDSESITIGITKKPNTSKDKIINWIKTAVIASEDKIIEAQDNRILGTGRKIIEAAPELELSSLEDMILLKVDMQSEYITKESMLCIVNLHKDEDPENIFFFQENKS